MADETMTLQDAIIELGSWGVVYPHIAVAPVIRALESAIAARKVPYGWQLVPIVPTAEMRGAGRQTMKGSADEADGFRAEAVYARMLATAPKVKP